MNESLSGIKAEIASYQAQMDTSLERETNRAKAQARQRFVEAESTANANAALLEAQALDIRALSAADNPEILEYHYEKETLDKLESLAEHLPTLLSLGDGENIDYLATARQMLGATEDGGGLSEADVAAIQQRVETIQQRVREREAEIEQLLAAGGHTGTDADPTSDSADSEEDRTATPASAEPADAREDRTAEAAEAAENGASPSDEQHQAGEQ